jgi:hypothetical protein
MSAMGSFVLFIFFIILVLWMQWMSCNFAKLSAKKDVYEIKTSISFICLFFLSVIIAHVMKDSRHFAVTLLLTYLIGFIVIFLIRVISTKDYNVIVKGVISGGALIIAGVLVGICILF